MSQNYRCLDCLMYFDNEETLTRHQAKFCTNSKYASLDSLETQFQKMQEGKDISLYGRPKIAEKGLTFNLDSQKPQIDWQKDKQYRELLRQIGDRQDLKQKLNRQKMSAEEQLTKLQQKEKELLFLNKQQQLQHVLKKREDLAAQEEQLQQEIRNFQKQAKQQTQLNNNNLQDIQFRAGREAGKLAMQRRILEEKKREIQNTLKQKKREEQKVNQELHQIAEQPIFIPDYRRTKETNKVRTEPRQAPEVVRPVEEFRKKEQVRPKFQQKVKNSQIKMPEPQVFPKSLPSQYSPPQQQKISRALKSSTVEQAEVPWLNPSLFLKNDKTLFQSLNPKGKSDEDIFIESLVAQEYDALNLLARLPKESELYQAKLKQFQEMSKIRQQLKEKAQKVRLEKVRREFELDKEMTETEKANLQWLDRNRQNMLQKEVRILNQHHAKGLQQTNNPYSGQLPQNPLTPSNISPAYLSPHPRLPSGSQLVPQPSNHSTNRAYRITIKSLRNYSNKTPVCVRVILTEQANSTPIGTFTSKYHDENAPKDDRNPYNPGVKNRLDENGDVAFNQSFEVGEDLQSRYNSRQEELYLWLLLMQKDAMKISNQPQIYAWYCFKLTHFGQLREGAFTLTLFHDELRYPEPPDMNKMREKAAEELLIELSEDAARIPEQKGPKNGSNGQNERGDTAGSKTSIGKKVRQTGRRKKTMKAQTAKKINSVHSIKQDFFIENEQNSEFQQISSNQQVSFDFSVVAARTMPSYTGPLKIQIFFMDQQGNRLFGTYETLAQFGSDMYNPLIHFTVSVKEQIIPPSCVVVVRMMALSTLNFEPGLIGFAYFHLCFDEGGAPLDNDNKKEYFLIEGRYQIPVYWGNCSKYLSSSQLEEYPGIPCLSLLVEISSGGREGQFADYDEGVYNTVFFQVQEQAYRLFSQQAQREKLATVEYVNAYFKFKGINIAKYAQNDLIKLMSQALAFNEENLSSLFVLHAMAEYSPSFGAVFAIDLLTIPPDTPSNYYYFCTACLYPPATFYTRGPTDLSFFYQLDLANSLTHELAFQDHPVSYFPDYKENRVIIVELNRVKLNEGGLPISAIETCGHTVLPFFDLQQKVGCVRVGIDKVGLYLGQFDESDIKSIESNVVRYLQLLERKKKSEYQLQVRLMNGFFADQLRRRGVGSRGKPLRSVFQNSKGFKQSQDKVKRIIEDTYSVQLH